MVQVVSRRFGVQGGVQVYIGRPGVLGNPFKVGRDGSREQVIEKYRVWLWEAVQEKGAVYRELVRLAGLHRAGEKVVLVCWCSPLPCHGDVVKRAVEWLAG